MQMQDHVARALEEELVLRTNRDGRGILRVDDDLVPLSLISDQCTYTVAFRADDPPRDVYAFVSPTSEDKDIAEAVHRRRPHDPHVPAVESLGPGYLNNSPFNVYRMPYYQVRPPEGSQAERDRLRLATCAEGSGDRRYDPVDPAEVISCARRWDVTPSVVEALEELVAEATSRKPYALEFQSFNTAVDDDGNLVLLDVLYAP